MSDDNPAWGTRETTTRDARGRPLQEGDEVLLNLHSPIYFRVAQITPIVDMNQPPGLYVYVAAILTFTAKRGAINAEIIRVRTAEEAGPQQLKMTDTEPAPGTPQGS